MPVILFTILFIIGIIIIIVIKKYNDNLNQKKQELLKDKKLEYDTKLLESEYQNQKAIIDAQYAEKINTLETDINILKERKDSLIKAVQQQEEANAKFMALVAQQKKDNAANLEAESKLTANALEAKIESNYKEQLRRYKKDLYQIQNSLLESARAQFESVNTEYEQCIAEKQAIISDFEAKIHTINEEIMRRREVEEQQDFYRIVLSQDDIEDISQLNRVRNNLHSHSGLDKLIYDLYIAKPVLELTKRVLHGGAPSGIYKITRLKTGEIYIGKSTDVKSRWQQHCKTVFGVGNIAHSILHTTMEKDGIENFTFELLEEVPKAQLGEREKYWIDFYDTKNYGLNERNGG